MEFSHCYNAYFLGVAHHAKEKYKGFAQLSTKPLYLNKANWP